MKYLVVIALCLFAMPALAEPAATFRNPILSGFYPDPSICRDGDDYYLVNSSFEYFPGVPIFHSRDLVHWRQIGHCLTRPSQLPLEKMRASGGIFAPTLRFVPSGPLPWAGRAGEGGEAPSGLFYLVTTNVWGISNFYCTATDPAGPWSDPVRLDQEGIDPSLFFDDDGKVYYTRHVGGGDGYIGTQELDLAAGKLVGEMKKVWRGTGGVWPEGPHMYKRERRYYLMIAEGGTSFGHKVTVARSDSPWGPFEACPDNPILTHAGEPDRPIQALGHADLVETPAGWWAVCLGIRPQGGPFHHLGRETYLAPVTWNDAGWPTIGVNGRIEPVMNSPKLTPHPWPAEPERDDFDNAELGFAWNFLRNPRDADWSLSARPGFLRLYGSAVTLRDEDSPAFVGRRQTALACRAAAQLEFDPQQDNEEAGLILRGNDKHHVQFGVERREERRYVFVRQVVDGKVESHVWDAPAPDGPVTLVINATPLEYSFEYAASNGMDGGKFGSVPAQSLSSERIGGFTGVYFGMYATGNGQQSTAPADFDWFDYTITER